MDPRGHVRAHRELAIAKGVHVVEQHVVQVVRDKADVSNLPTPTLPQWIVRTASGLELRTERVVFALGAWSNLSGLLPSGLGLPLELWGKCVYHACIHDEDASALLKLGMPATVIKYAPEHAPAAAVSYTGAKSGFYVYFFPPVQYSDGRWYVKIGHSPHDPLISALSGTSLADKLSRWMASEGEDVQSILAESAAFFQHTLRQILPHARFDGGRLTTCVTTKTPKGRVFLGPLSSLADSDATVDCEGLFACAGCDGAGAKFSHEWGRQVAEVVARTPHGHGSISGFRSAL